MTNENNGNGNSNLVIGEEQNKRAAALATKLDSDVSPVLNSLVDAKLEFQGGPFAVMFAVTKDMTEEELEMLPDPKSETGNNPARYKVRVVSGGKEKVKEEYFYNHLALSLPSVVSAKARIDMLNRSMGDPSKVNQADVPDAVKNMTPAHRKAEINRLNTLVNTAKTNVSSAFELYHQLRAFNDDDVKVSVDIIYALDPTSGAPLDGQEGRKFQVESTNTPIVLTSTIPGRAAIDTKMYSVGTFKRLDVEKAKEAPGGATFQALERTIAKGANNAPPAGGKAINTLETFVTTINDQSEYLHRVMEAKDKAAFEAMKKLAEKDDDFFYNLAYLYNSVLHPIVDNPRSQVRYEALLNKKEAA